MSERQSINADVSPESLERLEQMRLLVLDVDGVLTDGRIVLGDNGTEYKAFHTHDGHGIRLLQGTGVHVGIITGRSSAIVSRRAEELHIRHLMQGRRDKADALAEMRHLAGTEAACTAYVGDDVVDLAAMESTGLGVAVSNAPPAVQSRADLVTQRAGGNAAVRELCERIMAAQGTLEAASRPARG